jgi:hypothetical protein
MNTPPTPSQRPSSHATNHHTSSQARNPVPALRQQVERQSMSDRFSAKLDRDESAKIGQQREAQSSDRREDLAFPPPYSGEQDAGEGGAHPDLGQREALLRLNAVANLAPVAAPASASFDTALLSQMAAQIAQATPAAGASEVSIEFPSGALAQSAHIRREADGSIVIRIAGLDPRLSAVQNGRAQADLRSALALRRLQVSSVTLEKGRTDQGSVLSSPISRVV